MSSLQDQLKSRPRLRTEVSYWLEPARLGSGLDAIEMTDGTYRIGSGTDADIRVDVPGVAPLHCRIICERERITLQAEDTRTWLNDGPIRKASVRSGDRLSIGPANFVIRIDQRTIETPIEPVDEPVELAVEVARAIRQQRLDASARDLVMSGDGVSADQEKTPTSVEQELEELRKSLAQTQQQLKAHKAAVREQPEPVSNSLHTPMSELTGNQSSSRTEEASTNKEWEGQLREKTAQIQRLKTRLQQRKTRQAESLDIQRQQIDTAQQTLARQLEELSRREHALEEATQAQQQAQNVQLQEVESELESTRTELRDIVARLDSEQDQRQTLEEKLDENLRELETDRQENDRLRSELYREVTARAELESALSVERDRTAVAEQQRVESETRCLQYEEQGAELQEAFRQLQAEYEQQSLELESSKQLETQLSELQADRDRLERELEEALTRHRDEVSELQELAAGSEAKAEATAAELESARQTVEELQSVLAESAEQLQQFESRMADFEAAEQDHAQIQTERDDLLRDREEIAAERDELRNQFEKLTAERESLEIRLEEVAEQSSQHTADPAEHEQLQAEVQSLHEALRELKDAYEALATENEQLQSELHESQGAVEDLVAERDSLQNQLGERGVSDEVDESATAFEQGLLEEVESLRALVSSLETDSPEKGESAGGPSLDRGELDSEWERISDERDRLLQLRQAVEEEREAFRQVRLDLQQMQQEVAQRQSEYEQKLVELEDLRNELQQHTSETEMNDESVEESTAVDRAGETPVEADEETGIGALDSILWGEAGIEEALGDPEHEEKPFDVQDEEPLPGDGTELGLDLPGLTAALDSRMDGETVGDADEDDLHEEMEADEESHDLRKRLAEMFGLPDDEADSSTEERSWADESLSAESTEDEGEDSSSEENSFAEDTEAVAEMDEEAGGPEPVAEAPTRSANGEVIVDDIEDADSVAAYMERLFARTSGRQETKSSSAPVVRKPAPTPEPVIEKPVAAVATLQQEDEDNLNGSPESPPKSGPSVKVDRDLVMKEIASLRDVANQNARESLIAHKWKQLRVGVMMNVALTSVSLVGALVLFTAPLWYGEQFLMYAVAMTGLGLFSAYSLFNNYVTLMRMKQPASSERRKAPAAEESAESPEDEMEERFEE